MEKANIRNGVFKRMINKLLMPKAYVEALEILKVKPNLRILLLPTITVKQPKNAYDIIENIKNNNDNPKIPIADTLKPKIAPPENAVCNAPGIPSL